MTNANSASDQVDVSTQADFANREDRRKADRDARRRKPKRYAPFADRWAGTPVDLVRTRQRENRVARAEGERYESGGTRETYVRDQAARDTR